jgi:ribosome biogenesis GTPase
MIVAAESNKLQVNIVINKTDLVAKKDYDYWINLYEETGYKVFLTSVVKNNGIKELREVISGNTNVFWGYSGVGKSSLINAMFPDFNLKTGEISEYSNKGKHTTVTSLLVNVSKDTFILDTPGVREIEPYGIRKEDLCHYFSEFAEPLQKCRFNTCTHHHEPGCAVLEAVGSGEISADRYESYLHLLDNIEEDMCFQVKNWK